MKKKIVFLIIIANSVALLGIFFTQIYWVKKSYDLKEEIFANSVRIALKGVSNQMSNYQLAIAPEDTIPDTIHKGISLPTVKDIDPDLLDFKIGEEFNCMNVGKNYVYAIIDLNDSTFITGNAGNYSHELLTSAHQIEMTGFQDSDHFVLSAFFPRQRNIILMNMITWLLLSLIFSLILIISFYFTIDFFFRQKKLTEMKSDFLNNMTHEFKTPLATISLASEMLLKPGIQEDTVKAKRYAKVIFDENARLQSQVEQILHVSALERGRFRLKKKELDIHELILNVVDHFNLTIKQRNGAILTHLYAKQTRIYADQIHMTNVISNLLDNAEKYSPEHPMINISTRNTPGGILVSVEDRGVGISYEKQQQIFRKFYRIQTGNIYKVKGFGIGLYYVKTIVEAHGGRINLWSEIDKGSRFDIYLPFSFKSTTDDDEKQHETDYSAG